MTEATKKDDKPAAATADTRVDAAAGMRQRMGVRLAPVDDSDQPVLSNYTTVNVAPGMVFIDFGFLEPGMLNAIPRVASAGGKLPQQVNGKLAVRVAMGYDGIAGLHQQLGRVLSALQAASSQAKEKR